MTNNLINLTPAALGIIVVFAGIITYKAIPAIKARLKNEQFDNLYYWVVIAVKAAEQLAKKGEITREERKQKAMDFLRQKGFELDLNEVEMMIESVVLGLPPFFEGERSEQETE